MRIVLVILLTLPSVAGFTQSGSYSLVQCIEHAYANHPQIKLLEQGNTISLEQLEQLKAAAQPSLAFNASQNVNTGRSIDPFTYQFTTETIFSNNLSLNASIILFQGFKLVRSREQTNLLIEANKENIFKIKNDLALSIANQYLQVLLFKEQVVALDSQMAQTHRQLVREEMLFRAGKSNENKVMQLKAQALNEEVRKIDLLSAQTNALVSLKYAAAFKVGDFNIMVPDVEPILKNLNDFTLETVYAEAEKSMASVKYAKVNEMYFDKGIEVSKSGYYPSLTMTGSLASGYSSARKQNTISSSFSNQPIGYLFSTPTEIVYGPVLTNSFTQSDYPFFNQIGDNFSQFVGINLRVPILSNRNNKTAVQIARINLERAKTETDNTLLTLRKDVETAMNVYEISKVKMKKHNEIVELQGFILKNLETYYNAGNITLFELLNQKNTILQSNSSFIQSKYELVFRKLVLDYYTGKPLTL
jgi:outer membrane protein